MKTKKSKKLKIIESTGKKKNNLTENIDFACQTILGLNKKIKF